MTLATLATNLKQEPGVWKIKPGFTPSLPPDDAHATGHGHGTRPAIPSYTHRLQLTAALDTVRLYLLADDMPNAADRKLVSDAAENLFIYAQLDKVPEEELMKLILGHWPLPAPAYWLLGLINSVGTYLTALRMPPATGGDLVTAAMAQINLQLDALKPTGGWGARVKRPPLSNPGAAPSGRSTATINVMQFTCARLQGRVLLVPGKKNI
jgi:hypothetical protein